MAKKKFNIPIFVVHRGCPHMCSFCNQKEITGCSGAPDGEEAKKIIENALKNIDKEKYEGEIAFFGGSFTAIDEKSRTELLQAAYKYVKDGSVSGIRCSTRPDCIDEKILAELKKYGVTSIELGVQSTDEEVLLKNRRGHTFEDVKRAAHLIKKYGFELGLQMMPGLYKSTKESDIKTAEDIISLSPDTVRIYPTVVVKNSELLRLYKEGEFEPLSLYEAVEITAQIYKMCRARGIEVLRMGLMATDDIKMGKSVVAGPFHPAFGEMVMSRIFYEKMLGLAAEKKDCTVTFFVNPSDVSKAVGQKRENILRLKRAKNIDAVIKSDENVEKEEILCYNELKK